MSNERFLAEQLENSALEAASIRVKLKEISEQLNHAEDTLRFYSDPRNYSVTKNDGHVMQDKLVGDHSEADNDANTLIAGSRARRYFQAHAKF